MHPRVLIGGLLTLSALLLSPLSAQTHAVASPSQVTRAVAVYEWTGDLAHPTAARLIPVSLFINGHLEDAGVYLAQPIPFALQPGILYLIQHAGQTVGALELESADNLLTHPSPADDDPRSAWYGFGRFLTPAEAAAATTPQPFATPPKISADTDADTPPVLRHLNTTNKAAHKKADKQPGYVTPPTTPLNDDPDRPVLHRGIPADANATPQLTTLPPDLHQAAAVSDAANRAPETFAYTWPTSTERAQTLEALEALALPRLAHYIAFNNLAPASITTPASAPTFANTSHDSATTLTLTNEHLSAYTLTDGSLPTFIYTAESPLTTGGPVYLTLIAQATPAAQTPQTAEPQTITQLHLGLLSITDATHLGRTPWLRPIDAVDPDANRRTSILFELRAQTTRQFALYTLTNGEAEQQFISGSIQ
jgi:hypothetical protein